MTKRAERKNKRPVILAPDSKPTSATTSGVWIAVLINHNSKLIGCSKIRLRCPHEATCVLLLIQWETELNITVQL